MSVTIRDLGFSIGTIEPGPKNLISDVPGVTVGHTTIHSSDYHTGVTVVLPAQDNVFSNKLTAACYVHNGFGKTCGLMQIEELGTLETPIALTSTLNVGIVHDALVDYSMARCAGDGITLRSLNPVVGECNDGRLSRILDRPVDHSAVFEAIASASPDFLMGAVGAGSGTICYGLKGGIGSASRQMEIGENVYTLGVLVQSNFGSTKDLVIDSLPLGQELAARMDAEKSHPAKDEGSIITVLATDLPVNSRQLKRILRRCGVGLARTGSYLGHGSGEVMLGFTTENRVPLEGPITMKQEILREELLDIPFRAAAEATEEAVLTSLAAAVSVTGYTGLWIPSLRELLGVPSAAE